MPPRLTSTVGSREAGGRRHPVPPCEWRSLSPGECQHVFPLSRAPEKSGALERGEQRIAGVGIKRPESPCLLSGQPKSRHLKILPSDNLEQPDEVEMRRRTMSGRDGDHDSTSGKRGTDFHRSNTRTGRSAAISEKSSLGRPFDPRKISPACGKFRTQVMRAPSRESVLQKPTGTRFST